MEALHKSVLRVWKQLLRDPAASGFGGFRAESDFSRSLKKGVALPVSVNLRYNNNPSSVCLLRALLMHTRLRLEVGIIESQGIAPGCRLVVLSRNGLSRVHLATSPIQCNL